MSAGQGQDNSHLVKAPTHFPKSISDTSDVSQTGSKAYNAAKYSTGRTAASFTSTILDPQSKNESALIDEDELMFQEVEKLAGARGKDKAKGKAYARIITNFGSLSVELHCEKAPKTCYNWLMLARGGKYNGVTFHRNIPGFMVGLVIFWTVSLTQLRFKAVIHQELEEVVNPSMETHSVMNMTAKMLINMMHEVCFLWLMLVLRLIPHNFS